MATVLILENSVYVTGAVKSIVVAVDKLRDEFSFQFAMRGDCPAADFVRSRGFVVHDVTFNELSRSPLRLLLYPITLARSSARVRSIARASRAALIHVNDVYNLSGLVAGRIPPTVPVIHHVRLLRSSYIGPIYKALLWLVKAGASSVIAVSGAVRADVGVGPKVHIVHDAMEAKPMHPPKQYRECTQDCRFLYVGNYVRGKGQDLAIKAFSIVASQLPGSSLRFIGDGASGQLDSAYVSDLRWLAAKTGLEGRVQMHERAADVEAAMKDSDVTLNFSTSESFSMVCLEALMFGVPLISTDSGGPGELIEHENTGLLIANGSCEAAASAMLRLAHNPSLARRLGQTAALRTPARYSLETAVKLLSDIYMDVIRR